MRYSRKGEFTLRKNIFRLSLGLVLVVSVAGCAIGGKSPGAGAPAAGSPGGMVLTSSAFKDGGAIPVKMAGNAAGNANCVGGNVSPPLSWTGIPANTKTLAILVTDAEGGRGMGVDHWVSYGIPVSVTSLAEGEVTAPSTKYVGGKGTAGVGHYMGPCPPVGPAHHYLFTLIATDLAVGSLPAGLTKTQLFERLNGHAFGAASTVGMFGH
jgi:Raf kinase inhibitor-like YbhB/YbcL family protein